MRRIRARSFAFVLLGIALIGSTTPPAHAEYPHWQPSFAGETAGVSGDGGTECWVATFFEYLEGLDWVPSDCPGEDQEHTINRAWTGNWKARVMGRVELFPGTGRLKTGADVHAFNGGSRITLPPSYFANYSELWVSDGYSWWSPGNSGWQQSWYWTDRFTPTFDFGTAGVGLWYATWSGGYHWADNDWNGTWTWSNAVYVPCYYCLAASDGPSEPPELPKVKTKEPPLKVHKKT